jgi:Tol biopolymer transport system component
MTDEELERRLRDWYRTEIAAAETASGSLRSGLATIPSSLPSGHRLASRRGLTLLAAAALVGLLAAAGVAGGLVLPRQEATIAPPSDLPAALPSLIPSELPSARPSTAFEAGRIVYTRYWTIRKGQEDCNGAGPICHRSSVFISNEDGSEEHLLVPGRESELIAGSLDGSKLLLRVRDSDGDHMYLTDIDGAEPHRLDTGCRQPCVEDFFGWGWYPMLAFSPDGSRLAFVRGFADERSVMAIMDMTTGAVVELDSTLGIAGWPSWSPDGGQLLFGSFVVDADGNNLHQLVSTELGAGGPSAGGARWSPDGSLIVFASHLDTVAMPGVVDNAQQLSDIYTVRPDGTELKRLTTDTVGPLGTTDGGDFGARRPTWTLEGRIVFTRSAAPGEAVMQLWVMDRDGGNATRLDPSDASTLTAIGCVSCPYPATDPSVFPANPSIAFWVPAK